MKNANHTYRRSNAGSLHLVKQSTDFLEVCDMSTIWIKCTFSLCIFRQRVYQNLLSATGVDLEVQVSSYGVLPSLSNTFSDRGSKVQSSKRTIGNTFTLEPSQGGNSSKGNSRPSVSIPRPVGMAWAGAIQT